MNSPATHLTFTAVGNKLGLNGDHADFDSGSQRKFFDTNGLSGGIRFGHIAGIDLVYGSVERHVS